MCCGHQHSAICCRNTSDGITNHDLVFCEIEMAKKDLNNLLVANVPLDVPTIFRVGACYGDNPEFAYTDFKTFNFIRIMALLKP
jgi:hypothetical protein